MKSLKITLAILAVVLVFGLTSCSKESTSSPVSSNSAAVVDAPDVNTTISSLSSVAYEDPIQGPPPSGDNGRMNPPGSSTMTPFGKIVTDLKLTTDQQTALDGLIKAKKDCRDAIIKKLQEDLKTALQPFLDQQKDLEAQLRAGKITREEFGNSMKDLRTQMDATAKPLNDAAALALADCDNTFATNFRVLLTTDQQAIWDPWYAANKDKIGNIDLPKGNTGNTGNKQDFSPFGRIIYDLKLTTDQKTAYEALLKSRTDCHDAIMLKLRADQKAALQPFVDQQKALVADYKAGKITKDEFKTQSKLIRTQMEAAVKPLMDAAAIALKDCDDVFFTAFRLILTADQQTIWDAWFAKYQDMLSKKGIRK